MTDQKDQAVKRAVIYCRVSTKEQAEDGNSLVTQEKICREYALKNGYRISEIFIEQGESAKTTDRTELQRLFKYCAARKNQIDAVIAYKIDRISRNTDDYSQIRILLKRYGVEIKSTSEYFEDSPSGRFMENIIANVAQFDNDVRTERSVNGMRDACREGRYVWMAPIGYRNTKVNGKSTIVPDDKSPLILEAFKAVASGHQPIDHVRQELVEKGLTTRTGKPMLHSNFYAQLRNPLYKGVIVKFGESHEGTFTPIVPEELFDMVQLRLRGNSKRRTYVYDNPDFPLRRFVRDHMTGFLITGGWSTSRSGKRYPYYGSPKAKVNYSKGHLEKCFKDFLNKYLVDEQHFENLFTYLQYHLGKEESNQTKEQKRIQTDIDELVHKQGVLIDDRSKGYLSGAVLKTQMDTIENQLIQLRYNLSQVGNDHWNSKQVLDFVQDFLKNPYGVWKNLKIRDKRNLQWFEFPEGVTFDGNNFRTTKTCFLFSFKEAFCTSNVLRVPSNDPRLNQAQIASLKEDLKKLNNILKGYHPDYEDDLLTYHSRFRS